MQFALFLSPEGIALAHRQEAGHWAIVGETRIDVPDLPAALADLRQIGVARAGGDFEALLILPDDQILYTSLTAPTDDPSLTLERIEDGLDGLTPYPVAELAYDYRAVEMDRVKLAVVAKETLQEAQEFVEGHGFKAIGFAAMPPAERFPGLPVFFDAKAKDVDLPEGGLAMGPDQWADPSSVVESAEADEAPLAAGSEDGETEDEPTPDHATAEASETQPKDLTQDIEDTPIPDAPPAEDEAEAAFIEVGPDAAPEDLGGMVEPDELEEAGDHSEPLTEPSTPVVEEDDDGLSKGISLAKDAAKASEAEAVSPPTEEVAARAADTEVDLPSQDATDSAPPPKKQAGKPAGAGQLIRARVQRGATPSRVDTSPSINEDLPEDGSPTADRVPELPSFSARRGKVPPPADVAGQSVGTRASRLGFDAGEGARDNKISRHPDVTTTGGKAAPKSPAAAKATAPDNGLAGHLNRIRQASKSRKPARVPQAPELPADDLGAVQPPQRARTVPGATRDAQIPGALTAARTAQVDGTPLVGDDMDTPGADGTLSMGLLARRPSDMAGPSLKTGFILTVVLLILLAGVAIWSILFLPNNPVARLWSTPDDSVAADTDDVAPPAEVIADTAIATEEATTPEIAAPVLPPLDPEATEDGVETALDLPDVAIDETAVVTVAPTAPVLPDIDAELDLPPLPPMPQDLLPSVEETERIYAEDGIWPRTPDRPTLAALDETGQIYVASIDPDVPGFDAIALPDAATDFAEQFRTVPLPPPFGSTFAVNPNGLVEPTPEGVMSPEGAFIIAGRPPVDAVRRPVTAPPEVSTEPTLTTENIILGTFRPTPRPGDLTETRERQVLGGLTVDELASRRPTTRPVSAQEAAARASLFTDATNTAAPSTEDDQPSGSVLAVASSRLPSLRPSNMDVIVASAQRITTPPAETFAAVAPSVAAPQPSIPSNASVTRAATERNVIRLRDMNLIGVTGSASDRRALVRLPSGRFVRVGVGDRLDGGRVAAIGENSLQYVRRGRNITLDIPG
ncbi:MAG: hypothetical protein AAF762_04995 [Pseudomonadota bacterium]